MNHYARSTQTQCFKRETKIYPCTQESTTQMYKRKNPKKRKPQESVEPTDAQFEVSTIINHMVVQGDKLLYNVEWKPTIYSTQETFLKWLGSVKNISEITCKGSIHSVKRRKTTKYLVEWKSSWLAPEALVGCDEILPAYILLNMKKHCESILAHNSYVFCIFIFIYLHFVHFIHVAHRVENGLHQHCEACYSLTRRRHRSV